MLMNDHDIPGFWLQVSGGPVTHHVRHLSPTEILWFPGDSTPTGALRWSITCRISQAWWGEGRTSQGSDDTTKLQCQSFSIFVWFTKNWRFQMPTRVRPGFRTRLAEWVVDLTSVSSVSSAALLFAPRFWAWDCRDFHDHCRGGEGSEPSRSQIQIQALRATTDSALHSWQLVPWNHASLTSRWSARLLLLP